MSAVTAPDASERASERDHGKLPIRPAITESIAAVETISGETYKSMQREIAPTLFLSLSFSISVPVPLLVSLYRYLCPCLSLSLFFFPFPCSWTTVSGFSTVRYLIRKHQLRNLSGLQRKDVHSSFSRTAARGRLSHSRRNAARPSNVCDRKQLFPREFNARASRGRGVRARVARAKFA